MFFSPPVLLCTFDDVCDVLLWARTLRSPLALGLAITFNVAPALHRSPRVRLPT